MHGPNRGVEDAGVGQVKDRSPPGEMIPVGFAFLNEAHKAGGW